MSEEKDLTVKEVCKALGIAPSTVLSFISKGRFPGAYKLDPLSVTSPFRIPQSDIDNFLKLRRGEPVDPSEK